MYSLFVLNETYTNGYRVEVLDFLSLDSIICGILVIISKNPIVSVLFLIGLFLTISCYLIMLGINFIGLSYLLVYVGAVSILFLFILMLINVRISELLSDTSNSIPLAIIIVLSFNYPVYNILPYSIAAINSYSFNFYNLSFANENEIFYNNNKIYSFNKLLNFITDNDKIPFVTTKI